jgi:carbonic anhydrase/acetyltransferase-like protein (isoleucine patch superfamily)
VVGNVLYVLRDRGVVHARRLLSQSSMTLYALGDIVPHIDNEAFVHPDATIIGNVVLGPGVTVWPQAVLRGDQSRIVVGARTSVQDGAVLHCTRELETHIGADCTIGHLAHLEGCVVEDGALVGTGSIVLHRAIVRTGALVGAGAVVPNGMEVPSGAMALGVPAQLRLDTVKPDQIEYPAREYQRNWLRYRAELRRL